VTEVRDAIWVEITDTRGSAPRDAGTAMKVTAHDTEGTIGGGALEYRAIATARDLLRRGGGARREVIPLGPGLGQCCGGSVTLHYGYAPKQTDNFGSIAVLSLPVPETQISLWLWGAGHVGRAVVQACPATFARVTWIDSSRDRFPDMVPSHVEAVSAADMPLLAERAPVEAHHLIFTYAHDIDLALCAALIRRGAGSIGLIGSTTKWARFSKRLRAMNLDPERITCPIGDKSLGKRPVEIAHGTLRGLLCTTRTKVS
jgi:xanthine dehydrogenase accessory factor